MEKTWGTNDKLYRESETKKQIAKGLFIRIKIQMRETLAQLSGQDITLVLPSEGKGTRGATSHTGSVETRS